MIGLSRFATATTDRFWSLVVRGPVCWVWQGSRNSKGYGRLAATVDGEKSTQQAHRIAYYLAHGIDPADKMVCHHCDNQPCVRPDHLFLGKALDNARDMVAKGRQQRCARHYRAKLTEAQVLEIRESKESSRVLGKKYGVHGVSIAAARRGQNWRTLVAPQVSS